MADSVPIVDSGPRVLDEIQAGEGLSFGAAGRLFPGHRANRTVTPSTVWRWCHKGTTLPGGRVVRLECVRVGTRWLTSRGAIARFVAALTTATAESTPSTPASRSPAARHRASEKADATLKKMGG